MDVVMPQLGETVEEGTVSVWFKAAGDAVSEGEPLFEVETDKATTSIPALAAGRISEILVPAGETVKVGTRLAVIETAGDERARPAPQSAPSPRPSPPLRGGEGGNMEGVLSPRPLRGGEGGNMEGVLSPRPLRGGEGGMGAPRGGEGEGGGRARLSPVVKKLLAEHGLDPAAIAGSGAEGRITRDDVLAHVRAKGSAPATAPVPRAAGTPPAGERRGDGDDVVVPMSRIRRATAAHMVRSVATSPHVLQAVEVDFSGVEEARAAFAAEWKARDGFSPTYLPFVARAVCLAIPDFPNVNASVRGEELLVHRRVHLGVAVDLDREGLVVPVVRDAQGLGLRALAVELRHLAKKARQGGLAPDDLAGGTYTISNSGTYGTLLTAPIIHQPQVAILSTDGVKKRPVVVEGPGGDVVAIRPVGVLAQCFDHRAIDGAYSAAFLRRVKELLERRSWTAEERA